MKPKLIALAVVILTFATLSALRTHAAVEHNYASILPASIGSFRLMSHENTGSGEVVGTYGDGATTVLLDVRPYDRDLTHNGARCMLVVGEHPVSEDDRAVQTAHGLATFDIALFRSGDGAKLVASTECYANECAENPLTSFATMGRNQPLLSLTDASSIVPVSILIDGGVRKAGGSEVTREFERFAATLELGRFQAIAAESTL